MGMILPRLDSRPKKCGTPMLVPTLRSRTVALETWALSSMVISTVRMSPTRAARWSLKKVRAPTRHRELGEP